MTDTIHNSTRAVRAGLGEDGQYGAVVPPLYLTSTFEFEGFDRKGPYDYTRSGNPTRDALASALAGLEGGVGATITSSGMAALTLICHLLQKDELMIAPHDCYGGTHRLLTALSRRGQFRVEFVDQTDPKALDRAFAGAPRLVLTETPSNPLLRITDLADVARRCRQHGSILVADNTFLSPGWQRPIEFGADLVVHSTTKYLNGHSDVVGGVVVAASDALQEEVAWWGNCLGLTGAPFDSFLTLRGVRTLHARLRAHEENARAVVDLLCEHPAVAQVYYPGLADHPGHAIAARQQLGFGAMISFELAGGQAEVVALLDGLEHFFLAESLGGVESLVAHPATMTHSAMEPEARRRAGISENLVRLSVGIEHPEDLVSDLSRGLERALAVSSTGQAAVSMLR